MTVAHRLSTVMDADVIVVLSDGAIAETGSHGDLIARGGMYAELWSRQQASASVDDLAAAARAGAGGAHPAGDGHSAASASSPASPASPAHR